MESNQRMIKIYCNGCLGVRKHTVLHETSKRWDDYDDEDGSPISHETVDYTLAECNGCEHITLHEATQTSSSSEVFITQYPPQTIRKEPKWLVELLFEDSISNPYKYEFIKEIYIALRNNNVRLAVIGIRALLEQIMIEKVGDKKSFFKNLNAFQEDGYISRIQRDSIEQVIEAGHASIHRGFKAKKEEVIHLMDITENLIESIYINEKKSKNINVPKKLNK
jgi:hypothetical protein